MSCFDGVRDVSPFQRNLAKGMTMRSRRIHWCMLTALCLLASSTASSCTFRQGSFAEAQSKTSGTVIVRVLQVIPMVEIGFSQRFRYSVKILASERGTTRANAILQVEYVNYLATRINGSIHCPLNSGSGIEDRLVAGSSYRLLARKGQEYLQLDWAERRPEPTGSQTSLD